MIMTTNQCIYLFWRQVNPPVCVCSLLSPEAIERGRRGPWIYDDGPWPVTYCHQLVVSDVRRRVEVRSCLLQACMAFDLSYLLLYVYTHKSTVDYY
jgi:hypothetical protein